MNVDLEHRPRVREKKDAESKEKRPLSWKKRVKDEDWIRFREVLCQELKEKKREPEEPEIKQTGQEGVEKTWRDWLKIVERAAEGSIGRQKKQRGRLKVSEWDGELARLVEEQNRSRRVRDKSEGETRKRGTR